MELNVLPTTKEELIKLGWDKPDIIIISGDLILIRLLTALP
jgi:3',5'-cyclic AMP phosphodiesterase CpdA